MQYTPRVFEVNPDLVESSAWLYAGQPRQELEDAWQQLLKRKPFIFPLTVVKCLKWRTDSVVSFSHEEVSILGKENETVRFTDGSGYLGQLAVYHNLHCIVRESISG